MRAVPLPPTAGPAQRRLIIKVIDGLQARALPDGSLSSLVGAKLAGLGDLAREEGLQFAPLLGTPDRRLKELALRAEILTGVAQPDLGGLLAVQLEKDGLEDMLRVGARLRAMPSVEFAYLQTLGAPPPGDIPPMTSNLSVNQLFLGGNPGFQINFAWSQGYRGAGIRLTDCEYGWNTDHEDLVDVGVTPEPGQTIHPDVISMGWDDHGTSVLGLTSASKNSYGLTGIAWESSVFTYPEWTVEEGPRRETAVANALADSAFGDVVVLEMQAFGPGGGLAPAEVDPSLFLIVKVGVDAGVVVVAAAGNGSQNLDSAAYFNYRAMGDSGAIIVGAGTADVSHDAMNFSSYGERVDVQGWGEIVVSLGGSWLIIGGDPNQAYTNSFNGTSAATALIGGLVCQLQGAAVALGGARLPPRDIRLLLASTGLAQGSGGWVGPLPQMGAALAKLPSLFAPRWEVLGGGTPGQNGVPTLIGDGDLTPGSPLQLSLDQGTPSGLALLWLSGDSAPASFLGGTLHAWPFFAQIFVALDANGSVTGSLPFPSGQAPGTKVWYQMGVLDPTVSTFGGALSNAVVSTAP